MAHRNSAKKTVTVTVKKFALPKPKAYAVDHPPTMPQPDVPGGISPTKRAGDGVKRTTRFG